MAVKFTKRPWLGIAIPCFIISFIGYNAHYFILQNFLTLQKQLIFELQMCMIWLSYYLAIVVNPGTPVSAPLANNSEETGNFCNKCNRAKPQRAHHCKTCKQCVLAMDHHCPWTMNCVGFYNFPHFMRFLFWVIVTTIYLLVLLVGRACHLYQIRSQPSYLIHTSEIVFLILLIPFDFFVFFTIFLLFARCARNQIFRGMTQIETWEWDRIESLYINKRLMPLMLDNAMKRFNIKRTRETDEQIHYLLKNQLKIPMDEYVNFPYDLDIYRNAKLFLGPWWSWLLPWGSPTMSDGTRFLQNELHEYDENADVVDKLLSLPWPPDGKKNTSLEDAASSSMQSLGNIYDSVQQELFKKRRTDPRLKLKRNEWYNDWGESLEDFGVEVSADS